MDKREHIRTLIWNVNIFLSINNYDVSSRMSFMTLTFVDSLFKERERERERKRVCMSIKI